MIEQTDCKGTINNTDTIIDKLFEKLLIIISLHNDSQKGPCIIGKWCGKCIIA